MLGQFGYRRVLIVTDAVLVKLGLITPLREALEREGILTLLQDRQDGRGPLELQEGVDYLASFNTTQDQIRLDAVAGAFAPDSTYTIILNNGVQGIHDIAGNPLLPNRSTPLSASIWQTNDFTVNNYAIGGQTILNLDGTRPFKIQLAELDLPATEKLNSDRGVVFKIPVN